MYQNCGFYKYKHNNAKVLYYTSNVESNISNIESNNVKNKKLNMVEEYIKITSDFIIENKICLTWLDLKYGIDNKYLHYSDIRNYALYLFGEDTNNNSTIFELSCLQESDDYKISILLDKLVKEDVEIDISKIKNKWIYIILLWIYSNKDEVVDPLQKIELVYSDFDYPEIISNLIRYMPTVDPLSTNIDENILRLYSNWKNYLDENKVMYQTYGYKEKEE